MGEQQEWVARAILIGVGATAVMDMFALLLKRCLGVPSLDYALVGRWMGHFPRGRLVHSSIAHATPVRGERVLGWGAHYAIGILFAAVLLAVWGLDWARQPTMLPALLVGVLSVAAPFLIMQPGMGAGIAASRTPRPRSARLRSLAAHTAFGMGLYIAAWVAVWLI